MNKKLLDWLYVLIWCGLIFCFTASPAFTGDNTAQWISLIMEKLYIHQTGHVNDGFFSWNFIVRKLTHLTVFGFLAVLLWRALRPWRYTWAGAWLLTVLYAATDEWHQSFQPHRSAKFTDVLIDASGALIALLIVRFWIRKKK